MRRRLAAAAAFLACLLLPPELVVRAFDLDYRILAPLLYYQGAEVEAHAPVEDERLYALRAGYSGELDGRRLSVNSLGFRGPERPARKAPGTLRVLCYGSSNTYGARVGDAETWPARLEAELSRRLGRPVEVWNGGVCAYSLRQMSAAARLGLERYQPDLILMQPLHFGRRPLLMGEPIAPAFERDPSLLLESLDRLPFGGTSADVALLRWRLLRFFLIAADSVLPRRTAGELPYAVAREVDSFEAFSREAQAARVPWAFVLLPTADLDIVPAVQALAAGRSLELERVLPRGAGPDYRLVHPPAPVLRWYGRAIADFLWATPALRARLK